MKNLKDFVILGVGYVFQAFILICSTRLMTAFLSPLEMGRFSLLYAVIALFSALFYSCVFTYIQRKILEWNNDGLILKYFGWYVLYLLCTAVFVGGVVLIGRYFGWVTLNVDAGWIIVIVIGSLVVTSLNSLFSTSLNTFGKRGAFMFCSNSTVFFGLIFSLFLVVIFRKTAEFWILGQILGHGIMMLTGGIIFIRIINKSASLGQKKCRANPVFPEILHFIWPISVASLILWIQAQSYRFVVQDMHSLEIVGFITVGYNLGARLTEKVESLLLSFYEPIFYHQIAHSTKEQRARAWDQYAGFFFPTMLMVSGFICLGAFFLARIFFAVKFQALSGTMIVWGGIATFFLALNAVYTKVGVADMDMRGLIVPYTIGSAVTLGVLFLLSPSHPFWGTGLSLALGALTTLVCLMYKMHKLLPVKLPYHRMYLAGVYLIPLWVIFFVFRKIFPDPVLWQAVIVLGFAGIYVVVIELILNKDWLIRSEHVLIKKFYSITSRITG